VGAHGSALKVALTAPPERGKANQELLELLAEVLDVPVRAIRLVAGASSRDKRVVITGLGRETIRERLARSLSVSRAHRA
jgi:uncharacterized protein (TIGR00251 family)